MSGRTDMDEIMTQKHEITPVLLLTGYLGSGKTTLLNRILHNKEGIRFAVIVNDLGEVNIDEKLIQKGGVVGQSQDSSDLVALQNGCICCTLQTDLINQLLELCRSRKFDYIVIEASGICEPAPIAQSIESIRRIAGDHPAEGLPRLDAIVTVVDALRLRDEFASGAALEKKDLGEEDIERLIIEQIEFCNIILLNKISEVTAEEAANIKSVVRALQPKAEIMECNHCEVPIDKLLDTHLFDFEQVATSAAWVAGIETPLSKLEHEHLHDHAHDEEGHEHCDHEHDVCHCRHHHHHGEGEAEEYGIGTMVYFNRRPFDFNKFDQMLAREWPSNIIRAKGVIYFGHNKDMSLLFEQAGRQMNVKEAGLWYATAPEEELQRLMKYEPGLAKDWDPVYGDRMDKIVIIGRDLDRRAITEMLDRCVE